MHEHRCSPLATRQSLERLLHQDLSSPVLHHSLPAKEQDWQCCWQTGFTSQELTPGGTRSCLPHAHPRNPWLLHLSTINSAGKKESCGQLPESGPSEADRSRRGRRNRFISRAQESGSPAGPLPPHPTTGCRSPL